MTLVGTVRTRIVDGPHRWGRLDVRPIGRTMWATRTLVVHAPGTDRREGMLLRAVRVWPFVGLVLAGAVTVAAQAAPAAGAAVGLGLYALVHVLLLRATRRLRPLVRQLTVTTFHGNGRPEVHGDVDLFAVSVDALTAYEDALRAGRVDAVAFEAAWAHVWNALPAR